MKLNMTSRRRAVVALAAAAMVTIGVQAAPAQARPAAISTPAAWS